MSLRRRSGGGRLTTQTPPAGQAIIVAKRRRGIKRQSHRHCLGCGHVKARCICKAR